MKGIEPGSMVRLFYIWQIKILDQQVKDEK